MIDPAAARRGLAEAVRGFAPSGVAVVEKAFSGTPELPAVIIGQPSWSDDGPNQFHTPMSWPVAVVVDRPGSEGEGPVIDSLEGLWPGILVGLRDEADDTFGGVCRQSVVKRAQFGQFSIAGQDYPCQLIFIDLYG